MFVTAAQILLYVGVKTPSEVETAWAEIVANAVNDGINHRLNGAVVATDPPPHELVTAALYAGGEAYKRREAPFRTVTNDDSEQAIRLARDYLAGSAPIIDRYGNGPGIG